MFVARRTITPLKSAVRSVAVRSMATIEGPPGAKTKIYPYDGWTDEMEELFQDMRKKVGPKPTVGNRPDKICDSILDLVGNTPMVRVSRFAEKHNLPCEVLVKCEYFSAGGSVQDRIGTRMVMDAEETGRIKPGDTIIEPTSGNTGIGLSLAGAVRGYNVIIALPKKMSGEKVNTMKALGAQIVRTPTEAAWDDEDSHIALSSRIEQTDDNHHVLDQYLNPSNPLAHYDGTAEEILYQTDNNVDVIVMTAGTGGTVTGTARRIKEVLPQCQIVAVDPEGSILAQPKSMNETDVTAYQVEGIGYDFIPSVLNRGRVNGIKSIDTWVKTVDQESFDMARDLIRTEGVMCGGSAGSAMAGAMKYIRHHEEDLKGKRVVVLLADSIRNYMSKFLDDDWMKEYGLTINKE
jgi:cystathionine beta-synthase